MFSSDFGNEQIDNRVQEEKTEPGMPQTKKWWHVWQCLKQNSFSNRRLHYFVRKLCIVFKLINRSAEIFKQINILTKDSIQ